MFNRQLKWGCLKYIHPHSVMVISEKELVKFPQRDTLWPCVYEELEKVRYPYYDENSDSDIRLEGDSTEDIIL